MLLNICLLGDPEGAASHGRLSRLSGSGCDQGSEQSELIDPVSYSSVRRHVSLGHGPALSSRRHAPGLVYEIDEATRCSRPEDPRDGMHNFWRNRSPAPVALGSLGSASLPHGKSVARR